MAGANKPDGKNPQQRVAFTRRDADRIARTVRIVEGGDKKGNALTFGNRIRQTIQPAGESTSLSVLTGVSLSTAGLSFSSVTIEVPSTSAASTSSISVYNCQADSVTPEGQSFFLG